MACTGKCPRERKKNSVSHSDDDVHAPRLEPPVQILELGLWRAELVNDELANISYAGRQVLRAIRAVIRDHDWRTLSPEVAETAVEGSGGSLRARLAVRYSGWGARYSGTVSVLLTAETLSVDFDGSADSEFASNRIGLVVLHPPADSGRRITIRHPDGSSTESSFPVEISPHQPFQDIRGMEWTDDGSSFSLAFEGDVFETEDQRNWTDASFKTYSTPLSKPFPVLVTPGEAVHQSVTLGVSPSALAAQLPKINDEAKVRRVLVEDRSAGTVPPIGTSATAEFPGAQVRVGGLGALLVELAGPEDMWKAQLDAASRLADRLQAGLDVRIVATGPSEVSRAMDLLPVHAVRRLGVFDRASHVTEPELWDTLKADAARRSFSGELVAGTRAHFTELNRTIERIPVEADALTFSITPQMHATDIRHVLETIPMQRLVAENALRLAAGRPLHIGPISLKARFNAVATGPGYDPETAASMSTDELQAEPFTAAWTLASVKALSLPGVASITYFEVTGPRGISDETGELYPVGWLLQELCALESLPVLETSAEGAAQDGAPDVVVYPVEAADGLRVLAANLTAETRDIEVVLPERFGGEDLRLTLAPWTTTVATRDRR